jgi:DNA polymerase-3 subunit delta'
MKQFPNSLVMAGPSGIGKKLVARYYFNCLNQGFASSSELEKHNPEALEYWEPEKNFFSVDQVREITKKSARHPYPMKYRLMVLDEAEKLTKEAASALLKTLEEPPLDFTRFVLLTEAAGKLLPTIRSRSFLIEFFPLSTKQVADVLKGLGKEAVEELATMSGGSVGRALEFLGERPRQIRNGLLSFMLAGETLTVYSAFQFVDSIEPEYWPMVSKILETLVKDLVLIKTGVSIETLKDKEADLKRWALKTSEALNIWILDIESYIRASRFNLNHKLQLKTLMLSGLALAKGKRLP